MSLPALKQPKYIMLICSAVLLSLVAVGLALVMRGRTGTQHQNQVQKPISVRTPAPVPTTERNFANDQPADPASCNKFTELSDYVLKSIVTPDRQETIEINPYVITSFEWKRKPGESFITYPIISGTQAYYDDPPNRTGVYPPTAIEKDSDIIGRTISGEAKKIGLTVSSLNTQPFQSFPYSDRTRGISTTLRPDSPADIRIFGFKRGDDLYSIVLKYEGGHQQAPDQGTVTVTCGKVIDRFDKVYSALKLKAAPFPYDYDNYFQIDDVSPDNTVYALSGWGRNFTPDKYYYFNGKTAKLVSNSGYPVDCEALESQKVGKGMRCHDGVNSKQRLVIY